MATQHEAFLWQSTHLCCFYHVIGRLHLFFLRQEELKRLVDTCRVPRELADRTLQQLRSAGYAHASMIGYVPDSQHAPQAQQQNKATSSTKSFVTKQILLLSDGLFFSADVDR